MPLETHVKQYAILSGEFYFDPLINGVYEGERYLGNTPKGTLGINPQKLDHYDADSNVVSKDFSFATKVDRSLDMTLDEVSTENLKLFFGADATIVAQTATPVVGFAINNVKLGRYYQLGQSSTNPTGVRNVTGVAIKKGATVLVAGTDYILDAARARIYLIPTSATVADGDDLTADFTPAANSRTRLATGAGATVSGRLRFLSDNLAGTNNDYYFPSVTITPSGGFEMKGGGENPTVATMGVSVEILKPSNGEAIYIDGPTA